MQATIYNFLSGESYRFELFVELHMKCINARVTYFRLTLYNLI